MTDSAGPNPVGARTTCPSSELHQQLIALTIGKEDKLHATLDALRKESSDFIDFLIRDLTAGYHLLADAVGNGCKCTRTDQVPTPGDFVDLSHRLLHVAKGNRVVKRRITRDLRYQSRYTLLVVIEKIQQLITFLHNTAIARPSPKRPVPEQTTEHNTQSHLERHNDHLSHLVKHGKSILEAIGKLIPITEVDIAELREEQKAALSEPEIAEWMKKSTPELNRGLKNLSIRTFHDADVTSADFHMEEYMQKSLRWRALDRLVEVNNLVVQWENYKKAIQRLNECLE